MLKSELQEMVPKRLVRAHNLRCVLLLAQE